ncbi:carbon-nitrogen hydrolase [Coniochaeta sp. 2T2.1]|nr:carbon-nitrogen hydrolase [Coniochaeta sp. 2T2.1]
MPGTVRKIKVAVVQLHSKPLDPDGNFKKACDYIRQASGSSADLVVLPEYHLNGYLPQDPAYIAQTADCKRYLDGYCSLARELNICIVPGTSVERHPVPEPPSPSSKILTDSEGDNYLLYNTAYIISSTGDILGSYRKKNLWHTERSHQSRGDQQPPHAAFDTPIGRVGLLICWDLAFPEAFRQLSRDGADIVVVPTCWTKDESWLPGLRLNPDYEALFLNSTITSRCFENSCAVVFANAGGPEDVYVGLSQVAVPFVGPVAGLWNSEEGMVVAEIDTGVLEEAKANYRVREDMLSEDWHYRY